MRKHFFLLSAFLAFRLVCFGETGDSLHFLTSKDTIFLKIDFYGTKIFEHKLEKKQTIYSLARFYGLSVEELFFYNQDLQPEHTFLGQAIRIPIPNASIIRLPAARRDPEKYLPVYHEVRKGETLYRIAKSFYKLPMDTLIKWNRLENAALQVGQFLYVGWMSKAPIPDSLRGGLHDIWWNMSKEMSKSYKASESQNKTLKIEKGAAYWHKDNPSESEELFALHRKAAPGSVILVGNPMTRRTVYVRVLGKIPESAYPENIICVVSARTARLLGVHDARFFAEVKYWE